MIRARAEVEFDFAVGVMRKVLPNLTLRCQAGLASSAELLWEFLERDHDGAVTGPQFGSRERALRALRQIGD